MSSWKARLLIMLTILAMLLAVSMGPAIANDGSSDDGVGQHFGASGDDHDDDDDDGDDDDDDFGFDNRAQAADVDVDPILGTDCFLVTVEEDEDGDEELDVWLVCIIDGVWVWVEKIE
jgi:hypothetical protein